jgi:membrane dipeptidase
MTTPQETTAMPISWGISDAAARLHAEATVCDMTLPLRTPGDPKIQAQLPRELLKAGFNFVSFTVATDDEDTVGALRALSQTRAFFQAQSDCCMLADSVEDVVKAKALGKLAAGVHFQGTVPIGRDLGMVDVFYKLGIRHMLMAYNQKNFVADGCHELGAGGLSRFGREVVSEMNRVGMFVDVAHTGYQASMETIEYSDRPVIVSHGNVWSLHQHPRCYRDDQIKAIARSGGVIGLTGLSIFIGDDSASVESYVNQIDYVTQLVGPRHVGFGFDYVFDIGALTSLAATMANKWPADGGYTRSDVKQVEPRDVPRITQMLLDRGYPEDAVRAIIGENWMRLMREVWK